MSLAHACACMLSLWFKKIMGDTLGTESATSLSLLSTAYMNLQYSASVTTLVLRPGLVCCFTTHFVHSRRSAVANINGTCKGKPISLYNNTFLTVLLLQQIRMEGLEKLIGSRKAYRSHLMHMCGKLEELDLTQPTNGETTTSVISYIDQLQHKAELLQQLDTKIQSIIKNAEDLEREAFDAIEIQDAIIEKMTRLKCYLSKVNATAVGPPTLHTKDDSHRDRETGSRSAPASRLPKLTCQDFQRIR